MALTSLPDQKTPGRPIEITFAADTGIPSDNQEVALIGHAASGVTGNLYEVTTINNSGDLVAASGEAAAKWGAGSEITKMILAAIRVNQDTGNFVQLKAVALEFADTDFGTSDAALTAIDRVKAEFVVSPYDGQDETNRDLLKTTVAAMSAAQRVNNNQFGTFGVIFNRAETDPSALDKFDTQYLIGVWMPDTSTPDYSIGETAAAAAAKMASNGVPFNPLDDVTLNSVAAPELEVDWITVGFALESESALNQGWTPLKVAPNGEVKFVRTVTGRISADGSGTPVVTSYYDVQDFQTLYFWRKTLYTRFSQPDFKQRKASDETASLVKSEMIRLAKTFEDQEMFQAVNQLAKQFQVERAASDRHTFDYRTPVNVIPGLHVLRGNIVATTEFDEISI